MNTHSPVPSAVPPLHREAFAHVDHWIFDLDNTLYSHEAQVWPQVDARITLFLSEMFGLDGISKLAHRADLRILPRAHGAAPLLVLRPA